MTNKYSINLLQSELVPKKPLLSLKRVVNLWVIVLVLMLIVMAMGQYQLSKVNKLSTQLNNEKAKKIAQQTELSTQLSRRKTDPALTEQLSTLKLLTQNKRVLHANLTDMSKTYVAGFAKVMTQLSDIHQANISLENILISHDNISFSGIARSPDSVPLWMAGFSKASLLSGKTFTHFKLTENKQHYTEFVVSSNNPAESK